MTHIHHIALGVAITTLLVGCEANIDSAQSGGSGPGGAGAPGQSTSAGGAKQTSTAKSASGGSVPSTAATLSNGGVMQSKTSSPSASSTGGVMHSATTPSNGGVIQSATSSSVGGTTTTQPANGGSAGASQICCLAMAVCRPGDQQIAGPEACPEGVQCYSNSICCSQVWCAPATVQCAAVPVCDPGDSEVTGACPPDLSCYSRTLCGSTINCKRASTNCDPEAEYNRNYVADAEGCKLIKFACQTNTTMFSNACGCGCEQDSTCPEFVDCMPGPGTRSPLCSNTSCPFTTRAM